MGSNVDNYRVGKDFDGRRRISDEVRQEILELKGKMTQRDVAELFGISRRMVQFIWYPDVYEAYREKRRQEKSWAKYYSAKKHREYMRRHRSKKRELLNQGIALPTKEEGE